MIVERKWILACALPVVLAGCASHQQAFRAENAAPRQPSVGWVKQDWRICVNDCPKPTPKTVELSALTATVAPPSVAAQTASATKEQTMQKATARTPIVVHFAFAKAIPVGDWQRALETIERQVRPSDSLLIKAYTDDVGSTQYNDRLAHQRAEFVLSQLKARGVKNPVAVEAKGKCCYVESNATDAGRAANRRAEIHFINKKEIK